MTTLVSSIFVNCINKNIQMKVMGGGSKNIILINVLPSLFTLFFLVIFHHCAAIYTVTPTQYITDPQALVSLPDAIFKLGFKLGNSTNRYVGIWYYNIPGPTIIWVANRDKPLNDSSGVLRIAKDGNLVVLDGRGNLIWTTNVSNIASSNSFAELLDSGNLVLRETNAYIKGRILWQSFDHPSDTLLSTMKLGVNQRTGEKLVLTSWKDTNSDPSPGSFTLEVDPYMEVIVIKNVFDNQRHWQSGRFVHKRFFLGMPYKAEVFNLEHNMNGTGYLKLSDEKKSVQSRFVLDSDGKFEEQQWDDQRTAWRVSWSTTQDTECDIYGKCGPFGSCNMLDSPICNCPRGFTPESKDEWKSGNWSGGCVRTTALQCERMNKTSSTDGGGKQADGFLNLGWGIGAPDYVNWWLNLHEEECEVKCLNNCSCIAYSYSFDSYIGYVVDRRADRFTNDH